jgi:hypothetical protein
MAEAEKKSSPDFSKVKNLNDLIAVLDPSDEVSFLISRAIALRDYEQLRLMLGEVCGLEKGDEIFNSLQETMAAQMRYVIPQISNTNNINTTSASAFSVSIPPLEGTRFIQALGKGDIQILLEIACKYLGDVEGNTFIENLKPQLSKFKENKN